MCILFPWCCVNIKGSLVASGFKGQTPDFLNPNWTFSGESALVYALRATAKTLDFGIIAGDSLLNLLHMLYISSKGTNQETFIMQNLTNTCWSSEDDDDALFFSFVRSIRLTETWDRCPSKSKRTFWLYLRGTNFKQWFSEIFAADYNIIWPTCFTLSHWLLEKHYLIILVSSASLENNFKKIGGMATPLTLPPPRMPILSPDLMSQHVRCKLNHSQLKGVCDQLIIPCNLCCTWGVAHLACHVNVLNFFLKILELPKNWFFWWHL